MRLECPTCGARYRLDQPRAELLRARPMPVKCRACTRSWTPQ
ncbi:MAG: zinc-ribbon domain-containing protein, partial [Thermaurantiacus sp.]